MIENPFKSIDIKDLVSWPKEKLLEYSLQLANANNSLHAENNLLREQNKELEDKVVQIEGQLVKLTNTVFGKKSEKTKTTKDTSNSEPQGKNKEQKNGKKERKKRDVSTLLPSERYPNAEIIERHVELQTLPDCPCCQTQMQDSGLSEESEMLGVVPKKYFIIRQIRHKYCCKKCYGSLKTAPNPPRIIPGSSYSDGMVVDVAMSKYCDLIPINRYSAMAGREAFLDVPPNSLIGLTHKLADFIAAVYLKIRDEILSSFVLHGDETPHRMLEDHGDKKSWYLWGFSNKESAYFEIHNTRSGDVASEILTQSTVEYLVSDVFSGYNKAIEDINKQRVLENKPKIANVYCNAHSRRKFKESETNFPVESEFYLNTYQKIYKLEFAGQDDSGQLISNRQEIAALFEQMKIKAQTDKETVSSKSALATAINYFLKNYEGLVRFTTDARLPIDNNPQERLLRSPVIGRKTWLGTHSKQGTRTAAIFYTVVESCKLNDINPRTYLSELVNNIHEGKTVCTPKEYKQRNRIITVSSPSNSS